MYICCICYWFYLRRNDVQIIKQVSRMDRKEAIERIKIHMGAHKTGYMVGEKGYCVYGQKVGEEE